MIILIGGESHTGKTLLSQKLLERLHYPYLSLDHLKMGFIRGMTPPPFNVEEDFKISSFLWSITEGIIHTCLENQQNLIIEGVYLEPKQVRILLDSMPSSPIKALFLVFSKQYIARYYDPIISKENAIEQRLHTSLSDKKTMIQEHQALKAQCETCNLPFLEIQSQFEQEILKAIDILTK